MKPLIALLLAAAGLSAAPPAAQTFTGVIIDSECAADGHDTMRMGPTDAECAIACVRDMGAEFGLTDGKDFYRLSDQQLPAKFAAQKVTVTGTLDPKTKTITVDSIAAAK